MSLIPGYSDFYYGGFPVVPTEAPASRQDKPPKPDRQPERRNALTGYVVSPGGLLPFGSGNTGYSTGGGTTTGYGCTWAWQRLWQGNPQTYDYMLCHPKIAHAYAQIVGSILSGTWDVDANEGTPEAQVQFARDCFLPHRRPIVEGALLGMAFGCATAQIPFEQRDGRTFIKRPNWLPINKGIGGTILVEKGTGELLGIRWGTGEGKGSEDYIGPEAFVYTHQRYRTNNLHGWPRLENVRSQAWQPWLETWGRLSQALRKLAGMFLVAKVPAGNFIGPDGKETSFRDDVNRGITALANGDIGITLTNLSLEADDPDLQAKLAKVSLVDLSALDFGNVAITGYREALDHYESLMSEGMLRTPRTAGSGNEKHGGRHDTEQHTQTDLLDSQLLADDVDCQLNEQVAEPVMRLNFGDAYKPGSVRIKTKPLQDDTKDRNTTFIGVAMGAQGTLAAAIGNTIDMDKVITDAGFTSKAKWDDVIAAQQEQQQAAADAQVKAAQVQQQPPGNNGNGSRFKEQQPVNQ